TVNLPLPFTPNPLGSNGSNSGLSPHWKPVPGGSIRVTVFGTFETRKALNLESTGRLLIMSMIACRLATVGSTGSCRVGTVILRPSPLAGVANEGSVTRLAGVELKRIAERERRRGWRRRTRPPQRRNELRRPDRRRRAEFGQGQLQPWQKQDRDDDVGHLVEQTLRLRPGEPVHH